jgi:hypothetical protein
MEPEPDDMPAVQPVDLSPLAPPHTDAIYARVAARAMELRKLRRAVVRRGAVAMVLASAAAVVFWLSAPRHDASVHTDPARSRDILDLGMRGDVDPFELLDLGGSHAQ